jgi:hypothetical protein
MPQPEGWSVGVTVVNPQLSKSYPEYKVETTGNKTKCYIESVEGQPFKISISLNQTTPPSDVTSCFTAHCYVDGQQSDSLLFGKCREHVLLEAQMSGRRVAVGKVAPFEFGATRFTGKGADDSHVLIGFRGWRLEKRHTVQLRKHCYKSRAG